MKRISYKSAVLCLFCIITALFAFTSANAENMGFVSEEDGIRYYYPDGSFAKGWVEINDKTYRFDPNTGALFEGNVLNGVNDYYFDETHATLEGLVEEDGGVRFYKKGVRQCSWADTDGDGVHDSYFYVSTRLRCEEDRMLFDGVDARRFFIYDEETGHMSIAEGFYTNENGTQYFQKGIALYGWVTPDGEHITNRPGVTLFGVHYFTYGDGINHYMVESDNLTIGGVVRQFDENNCVLSFTGWYKNKTTGNDNYYVDGVMQQGWCLTSDGWVYLSRSENLNNNVTYGDVFQGWKTVGGRMYYFRVGISTPAYVIISDPVRDLNYNGVRSEYYINQEPLGSPVTGADFYVINYPGSGIDAESCSHSYGNWAVSKKVNCEFDGKEFRNCKYCGKYQEKTIEAWGHSYIEGACEHCGISDALDQLEYRLSGNTYRITGIGEYTGEYLVIPSEYNGLTVTEIGEGAFYGCDNLIKITVPDNVTSIGKGAFQGCEALVEITLPFVGNTANTNSDIAALFGYVFGVAVSKGATGGGTSNGNYTVQNYMTYYNYANRLYSGGFYIPKSLRRVNITSDTTIPFGAFNNCDLLTTVTLPDGVTSIGNYAFSGCSSLKGLDGSENGIITIPSSVTSLGNYSFSSCKSVYKFNINMTGAIGTGAFSGCSNATTFNIGENVTSVGEYSFSGCTSLEEIVIPENVKTISLGAFKDCSSLTEMTLPFVGETASTNSDIKSLFGYIFGYAVSNGATGSGTSQGIYTVQQYKTYYNYSYRVYTGGFYIPKSLRRVNITSDTTIPYGAFQNCDLLISVNLPGGVASIGDCAFNGCSSLMGIDGDDSGVITIPKSVTALGMYAFMGCTSIQTVNVNMTGSTGNGAFSGCSVLNNINIGETVTGIGEYSFSGCTLLTEMTVPKNVKTIGLGAFKGCNALVEMTLPFIGESDSKNSDIYTLFGYIFGYTTSGDNVGTSGGLGYTAQHYLKYENYSYRWYTAYFYIPESLRRVNITDTAVIPYAAFENCDLINTVVLPDGITSIADYAFNGCTSLKGLYGNEDGVAYVPETLKSIGYSAFAKCTSLNTLNLDSNSVIGKYSFSDCSNLSVLNIGKNVTQISDYAFMNCTSLTRITVPENVTAIGCGAFQGCNSLEELIIPFIGNTEGTDSDLKSLFGYIFGYTTTGTEATTSEGLGYTVQNYITYENYIKRMYPIYCYIPESLRLVSVTKDTTIPFCAFVNCDMIEVVALKAKVTSIGDAAFANCTNLTDLYTTLNYTEWDDLGVSNDWNSNTYLYLHRNIERYGLHFGINSVYVSTIDTYTVLIYKGSSVDIKVYDMENDCFITLDEAGIDINCDDNTTFYDDKLHCHIGGHAAFNAMIDGEFTENIVNVCVVDVGFSSKDNKVDEEICDYVAYNLDVLQGIKEMTDTEDFLDTDLNTFESLVFGIGNLSNYLQGFFKGDSTTETELKKALADFISEYVDGDYAHRVSVEESEAIRDFAEIVSGLYKIIKPLKDSLKVEKETLELMENISNLWDKSKSAGINIMEFVKLTDELKAMEDSGALEKLIKNNSALAWQYQDKLARQSISWNKLEKLKYAISTNEDAIMEVFGDKVMVKDILPDVIDTSQIVFESVVYLLLDYSNNIEVLEFIRDGMLENGYSESDVEIMVIDELIGDYKNKWVAAFRDAYLKYAVETLLNVAKQDPLISLVTFAADVTLLISPIDEKVELNSLSTYRQAMYRCIKPINEVYNHGIIANNVDEMKQFLSIYISIMMKSNKLGVKILELEFCDYSSHPDMIRLNQNLSMLENINDRYIAS